MAVQARAQATRTTIVAAAVDVFDEMGYGEAGLVDILNHARVTKGAFYYHFPTKESLAAAIVEEGYTRIRGAVVSALEAQSSPSLEKLIRATFLAAESFRSDQIVRVGHHLRQAMPTEKGIELAAFASRRSLFVSVIEAAIAEGDILDDTDAAEVADAIRAAVVGTNALLGTTDSGIFLMLGRAWRVILRGIVPPTSLPYFQEYVTRMADQFANAVTDQAR